jgi:hypothetical protein
MITASYRRQAAERDIAPMIDAAYRFRSAPIEALMKPPLS